MQSEADTLAEDDRALREAMTDPPSPSDARGVAAANPKVKLSIMDRLESSIAKLSSRGGFWQKITSLIWLPYAFKSGIRMKRVDERTFTAELPFRRFNRNWYNAMAGASLLANAEIAGGMYVMNITGGGYTLVCKELSYKFLRPCFGPAIYKVVPREDIHALIATGKEFNITVDLEVVQQPVLPAAIGNRGKKDSLVARLAAKERRVGKAVATFHVVPVLHHKAKRGSVRAVGKGSEFQKDVSNSDGAAPDAGLPSSAAKGPQGSPA